MKLWLKIKWRKFLCFFLGHVWFTIKLNWDVSDGSNFEEKFNRCLRCSSFEKPSLYE